MLPGPFLLSPFAKFCCGKTGLTNISLSVRISIPELQGSSRLQGREFHAAEPTGKCWGCVQEMTKRWRYFGIWEATSGTMGCSKEIPAPFSHRHEQVWVVIACMVTSEQKSNLKINHCDGLEVKMLCCFHCLQTVLVNSTAGKVSDFNSWIFFLTLFFPNGCHWQPNMPQACYPELVTLFLSWMHLMIAWIIEKLKYFK